MNRKEYFKQYYQKNKEKFNKYVKKHREKKLINTKLLNNIIEKLNNNNNSLNNLESFEWLNHQTLTLNNLTLTLEKIESLTNKLDKIIEQNNKIYQGLDNLKIDLNTLTTNVNNTKSFDEKHPKTLTNNQLEQYKPLEKINKNKKKLELRINQELLDIISRNFDNFPSFISNVLLDYNQNKYELELYEKSTYVERFPKLNKEISDIYDSLYRDNFKTQRFNYMIWTYLKKFNFK